MGALSRLWLLPALGAAALWLAPARRGRGLALLLSGSTLAYSLWLLLPYGADSGPLRLEEMQAAGAIGIRYHLGVDGLSLPLCWLTTLLTFLSLAASRAPGLKRGYWSCFLALEACLLGVFTSQNLFYFLVFWDLALIPMFFIIGLWGSEGRRRAALKFLLYTFLGSLSLMVGLIALATLHHQATGTWTWDIPELAASPELGPGAFWAFAAVALGFAVKIPVWPLHNWLPDAHTEAPAAGSVMLAGVMLKMGVYGLLRVLLPLFPRETVLAAPWLGALGAASVLYGAACALAQSDLKRLVAYTSVSHMGFCLLGIFSLTPAGLSGAALQMVNHGLSTGGLFLLVGILYERAHRRGVEDFGGLASTAPRLAFFFGLLLLSSIGLPGLNGFVGEFLSLAGMAKTSLPLAAAGAAGAVLAAGYAIPTYQKVFWAPAGPGSASGRVADLDRLERWLLCVLSAFVVWIGLCPGPLLSLFGTALVPPGAGR